MKASAWPCCAAGRKYAIAAFGLVALEREVTEAGLGTPQVRLDFERAFERALRGLHRAALECLLAAPHELERIVGVVGAFGLRRGDRLGALRGAGRWLRRGVTALVAARLLRLRRRRRMAGGSAACALRPGAACACAQGLDVCAPGSATRDESRPGCAAASSCCCAPSASLSSSRQRASSSRVRIRFGSRATACSASLRPALGHAAGGIDREQRRDAQRLRRRRALAARARSTSVRARREVAVQAQRVAVRHVASTRPEA